MDTLEDEVPAASFTVGEFKPPYPREEICRQLPFSGKPCLMENKDAVAATGRPDTRRWTNALRSRLREAGWHWESTLKISEA